MHMLVSLCGSMKKLNSDQSAQVTQPLHLPPHQPPSSTPTSFLHTNHHSHNTHSFTSSLPVQWCILPKKHNPQTPLVSQPSLHPWISVKPIFISLFQLQVPPVKGQSTPESLLNRGLMATPSWVSSSFFFPFLFSCFPFSFFFFWWLSRCFPSHSNAIVGMGGHGLFGFWSIDRPPRSITIDRIDR